MTTKEQDIETICCEILSLRDEAKELYERSKTIQQKAIDTVGRKDSALMALAALLGDNLKPVAFLTRDPTDGRAIIVVLAKASGQLPSVQRLEVLSGLGPKIGEIVDPDFEVVEEAP